EGELALSWWHHLLPGSAKLGAGPAAVKRGFELDATCASPTTCNAYAAWPIFAPDLHVSAACTRAPSIARKRREERVHTLRPGVALDACAIVAPSGRAPPACCPNPKSPFFPPHDPSHLNLET